MLMHPRDDRQARRSECRMAQHLARKSAFNASLVQSFFGEVETSKPRIFVEIAQNIGELQSAAEMMRQRHAVVFDDAKNPIGKPAHCARDTIAIMIERG